MMRRACAGKRAFRPLGMCSDPRAADDESVNGDGSSEVWCRRKPALSAPACAGVRRWTGDRTAGAIHACIEFGPDRLWRWFRLR